MFEDLIFALRNFKRNKTRTILSLLGVIIGVASVIVITTIGKSATNNVKNTFGSVGLNLVRVSEGFMRRGRGSASVIELNEAFSNEIFDSIKSIKKIWKINSLSGTLSRDDNTMSGSASAIEYGYLEMCALKLDYGNFFSVSDDVNSAQVTIISHESAEALFPEGDAVGKTVILTSSSQPFGFVVIGVLAEQSSGMESSSYYVPRGFYTKKIDPAINASTFVIETLGTEYASTVTADMRKLVEEKTGDEYAVMVMSMQSILEQYEEVTGTMSLLLAGIAAISLLVGGIGIMNIMIVTVTERKKEIGLRKAIGASPGAIRAQFLVESAAITLLGGIIGIILGIGISAAVVYVMKWPFVIQSSSCLIAFLFSAFIGVFFGFNPASRAAKLDPVAALTAE
jgi:putative ABC transport system permease protein